MRTPFRWLLANLGLLILSFVLALLVWVVAVEQENPTVERRYSSPVPLVVPDPPEGMVAYGETDVEVYVTLRAPESVWRSLRPEDIHATVDLDGLGEGTHTLEVVVSVDRRPVMVRGVEPEEITIQLEREAQALVPVNVRIEGNTPLGYVARPATVTPLTVTVSGPASFVSRVAEAVARVSVEGGRADVDGEFALEPHDEEGEVVPYVTLSPASVAAHVPIEQLSGFRDLAVVALLEGQVAPGYRISRVTVDPPVVTVFGAPDAIAQAPGYLQTAPLNLEGAWEDVEVELPLEVPEGISLTGMEDPFVTVRVVIVPQVGSVTVERQVETLGLVQEPGITVTVAPTAVQVILSGPLPVLEQLGEEDVRVVVDLFGLTPGSYSIAPRVVKPDDVIVESVVPATVQVEIVAGVTPTPED